MEISTLVASFIALIIAVAKKFNWLPSNYEALVSAVLGLAAQVFLAFLSSNSNPELLQTTTFVLNLLIGALSGIAGTQLGNTVTQTKLAVQSLRK